ncbi:MAG TPA: ATP-binding protein [Candidatus Acidoferrum sp.]|jgi:signal transduction histidine kinase|nr:ATP-binding protein [Candidatus Acidoferrum sp.]
MRLSLKTKSTLAISILVLVVVSALSGLYIGRLTQDRVRTAEDRASFIAQQILNACGGALNEANERGDAPISQDPADVHEYVRRSFDNSSTLNELIESDLGYSPTIYDILITDRDGIVLVSSDSKLRGQKIAARPALTTLVRANFFQKLRTLYGTTQTYEYSLAFDLGQNPFGSIRVGLSSALIRDEISPTLKLAGYVAVGAILFATLLAFVVTRLAFRPLDLISAQLDRISAGEFDAEPAVNRADELGVVSTKITGIGKQLRDVREIFSALQDNLDQVMTGLGEGLLLFNAEGRAVLVSPAVAKFLGRGPEELQGLLASEIFPAHDPIREALRIHGDEIEPVEGKEVVLEGPAGPYRAGVNAQVIREGGQRMGTLVTLQDVESFERIGNQLQVSERLAALGRVTAGVAHEVKNPLNSMRLWLEVLKANMPVDPEPQQAVKMLDSEIDRLDRAVKTFLNFTRPVEFQLEETDVTALLAEIIEAAKPMIVKAGLDLRTDLPSDFPALLMDRQLIHQAVLNLLMNACDFTARGGRIALALRRNGEFAEISVTDSGKGIPVEEQKKIFQLFHTTRPGGTGIGLANTFRFVQLHNGRIEFESEPGRGTTFRIELPLARYVETPAEIRGATERIA